MSDKRTASGIHVVKPTNAVYGPEGQVLAVSNDEPQQPINDTPVPLPTIEDGTGVDTEAIEPMKMYLIDDWVLNGHRVNIVGVYDDKGILQGGMYVADHDGSPHSLIKPEEEKGVLFHRLCDVLGVPTQLEK